MYINLRVACRPGRQRVGLGLAAGAGLAAVALGLGIAHADPTGGASTSADPATLLDSAAADLTQASEVLSKADVPASLQHLLSVQTQSAEEFSQVIAQAQSIQDPLLSNDNTFVAGLANLFFGDVDQKFAQASAAVLSADQAFAADPSQSTEAGLIGPDFQLDGAAIDSVFPDVTGVFVDRLLGIPVESPDAAVSAGADLATGFDLPL
jgi:hypothetical protein